jgi:hypothetical protein
MNFNVETLTSVFAEGTSQKIIPLKSTHANIPIVTVSLLDGTNANFNAFTFNVTRTQVVVRLSANAPSDLTVNVHAISRA